MIAVAGGVGVPGTAGASPLAVSPGDTVWNGDAEGWCTLGFTFQGKDGAPRGLFAGHCGEQGRQIMDRHGRALGVVEESIVKDGWFQQDTAVIAFQPGVEVSGMIPAVGTPAGILTLDAVERMNPVLCKLGRVSGLTCGEIVEVPRTPWNMVTFIGHSRDGDSGSPVWAYGDDGEILIVGTLHGDLEGDSSGISFVDPAAEYLDMWSI